MMPMPNTYSRNQEAMDDHEDIPWREMIDAMAMSSHANELPLLLEEKYLRECISTLNKASVSPAESNSGCGPQQELQEADDEFDEGEEEFRHSELKIDEEKEKKRGAGNQTAAAGAAAETGRKRRRRAMKKKNTEEVEYQRMVHIAVERNRRRQMNDHLAVLRSLMPPSYIQRGDQASIVGGAIEFVKELEHTLQSLIQRRKTVYGANSCNPQAEEQLTQPFQTPAPQQRGYDSGCTSSTSSSSSLDSSSSKSKSKSRSRSEGGEEGQQREVAFCGSCHAQVEVERVGPLFQVKVIWIPSHGHGYLLRLIAALQHSLGFLIRHLHVSTSVQAVVYSVDVEPTPQVGADQLISIHELAYSVHHIFGSNDLMDSAFS